MTHQYLKSLIKPGITTGYLNDEANKIENFDIEILTIDPKNETKNILFMKELMMKMG